MINADKCNGSCNAVNNLSTKTGVSSEWKAVNVKVFNKIKRIKVARTLVKHTSCDCKFNLDCMLYIDFRSKIE